MARDPLQRYLVIGGLGFLGSYIVEALLARGEENVFMYDMVLPLEGDAQDGATYFKGDILDENDLLDVLQKEYIKTVFHTVSPLHGAKESVHFRVNVEGTRTIVSACRKAAVTSLIFASSTGAVWTGGVLKGIKEEDRPLVASAKFNSYGYTKALAEE